MTDEHSLSADLCKIQKRGSRSWRGLTITSNLLPWPIHPKKLHTKFSLKFLEPWSWCNPDSKSNWLSTGYVPLSPRSQLLCCLWLAGTHSGWL